MTITFEDVDYKNKICRFTNTNNNFSLHICKFNGFIRINEHLRNDIRNIQKFINHINELEEKSDIRELFDYILLTEKETNYYGLYLSPLLFIKICIKMFPQEINNILSILNYIISNYYLHDINIDGIYEMLKYFDNNRDLLIIVNYKQQIQKIKKLRISLYGLLILYIINVIIILTLYKYI